MATIATISAAIETRLDTVDGLRVSDFPEPALTPPLAYPVFTGWLPISSGRAGYFTASFDVFVFTGIGPRSKDSYRKIISYADWSGSDSIYLALWDGNDQAAGTFGGLADTSLNMDVGQGFRLLGVEEVDAYQMFGGVFAVEVHTKG